MEQITLDMIPNSYTPTAHISQYDSGRHIRFNLLHISLNGDEVVTLKIRKTNNELVSKIIENHTNYVEYVSEKADCDVSGKANSEIVISKDDVVIGSKNFILNIEADPYDNAGVITETASGQIATFETNMADVLRSVKCEINAKQDLHGYDHPWPAGGGVNILKPIATDTTVNSVRVVGDDSGKVTVTGTASADTQIEFYSFDITSPDNYTLILKDDLSGSNNTYWLSMAGVGAITSGHQATFSFTGTGTFKIRLNVKSGSATNFTVYPMVAKGNVDIPYAPYSNVCPISGFDELNIQQTGVNIWDEEWENGDISSSTGEKTTGSLVITKNFIPVKSGTNCISNITLRTRWYDAQKNYIGSDPTITQNTPFTVPNNACYLMFTTQASYGTTYNNDISINYPATDTQYHSYSGKLIKLEFDDTVYLAEVSCLNGVWKLKLLGAIVDMGDLTYTRWTDDSTYYIFYAPLTNKENTKDNTGLCSYFPLLSANATSASNAKERLSTNNSACLSKNTLTPCVYLRADQYTTTEALVAALSGQKLVYELATPTEITLDETEQFEALLGVNNVWHDGNGNTEVKYLYNA